MRALIGDERTFSVETNRHRRGVGYCAYCKFPLPPGYRPFGLGQAGQCPDRDGCLARQKKQLQRLFKSLDVKDLW